MTLIIDKPDHGKTVKEYLFSDMHFSASLVKKLKSKPNGILINGEHVTVRHILSCGDVLSLACEDFEDDVLGNITPVCLELDIIYEDDNIIALNKPAKMPTHPSHNHHEDTLANALAFHFKEKGRPFVFRAINRLDADTSGIVLVAKSMHSAHLLQSELARGGFDKKYIAILHGTLSGASVIDAPIMRKPNSTMLRCVDTNGSKSSKPSMTSYEVIATKNGRTLVCASPITGRTHQLRVHFSHIGHPILGDGLYGITSDGSDYTRLALHCKSLSFKNPFSGKTITLEAKEDPLFAL